MYTCESWTIKKAECQRTGAFELWFWRRLLRVPWTARSSNQSILKQINPEYSLEGLMLKLKLQYFGHLIHRANSLENALMHWEMSAIVWYSHLKQALYFFFPPSKCRVPVPVGRGRLPLQAQKFQRKLAGQIFGNNHHISISVIKFLGFTKQSPDFEMVDVLCWIFGSL